MLEAFQFAKAAVQRAYDKEGLISTEHAVLDDNGDKVGSPDPSTTAADGKVAALMAIGSAGDAMALPAESKMQARVGERGDLGHPGEVVRLVEGHMETAKD